MISPELSIGDLADAAGVSRRTVRFYVQQRLLPPPLGRGRGRHYDGSHVERLRRIGELQSAGHSLDGIRRILDGADPSSVPTPPARSAHALRANLSAQLWTRLRFGEGIELHYDAARHNPTAEQLLRLRDAVRDALQPDAPNHNDNDTDNNENNDTENDAPGRDVSDTGGPR